MKTAARSIDPTRKKYLVLGRNCGMCLPKSLLFVFLCAFFSRQLIFTLLAAIISHFLSSAMKFACFFFQRNFSPLFLITRSSYFSVIQVNVDKKSNVEKGGSTLLLFLSLKVREAILFLAKTPRVASGVIPVN